MWSLNGWTADSLDERNTIDGNRDTDRVDADIRDGGRLSDGISLMVYQVRWTSKQLEAFAMRCLAFRKEFGLTQAVVAEALGISVATVNRNEREKYIPREKTVIAFSELVKRYKAGRRRETDLQFLPGDEWI